MGGNNLNVMTEGLVVTVLGVGIVFIVLLVIMGILSIFNLVAKINAAAAAKASDEKTPVPAAVPVPAAKETVPVQQDLMQDTELVAVITAAIAAASAGSTEGTDGLVVKSIRRIGAWNAESLSQQSGL